MKKNIILVGTNGAGKTTLANKLYGKGYHYFKLSPLAEFNQSAEILTLDSNGVVFDRWSVIDLVIYRNDREMLDKLLKYRVEEFNKHNLVVFLHQGSNIYDGNYNVDDGQIRVVERPDIESARLIDTEYNHLYHYLSTNNINIIKLQARGDIDSMIQYILEKVKE